MSHLPRGIDIYIDAHDFPVPQCIIESTWNSQPWVEISVTDPPMREKNAALTVAGTYRLQMLWFVNVN